MKTRSRSVMNNLLLGAVHGGQVWTIYGIIETFILTIVIWKFPTFLGAVPPRWKLISLIFIAYPVFGLLFGGLIGLGLHAAGQSFRGLRAPQQGNLIAGLAILTVIVAFNTNLLAQLGLTRYVVVSLFVSVLLVIVLILKLKSMAWHKRLAFVANPFTVSLILVGLPWIVKELLRMEPIAAKLQWSLAYVSAVLLVAFVVERGFGGFRNIRQKAQGSSVQHKFLILLLFITIPYLVLLVISDRSGRPDISRFLSSAGKVSGANVVLIVLDTVRADHTSVGGYQRDTTPNLMRLAEEATVYANAIASSDMSLASHASLLTGMYASWHGAHYVQPHYTFGMPLRQEIDTLPEILQRQGYFTAAVVANYGYLGPGFGLDQGFDYSALLPPFWGQSTPSHLRDLVRRALIDIAFATDRERETALAEDVNKHVFSLLEKVRTNQIPFFLFLNYMDAHTPYLPPSPFDMRYPGQDPTFTHADFIELGDGVRNGNHEVTEAERRHLVSQYDGAISYLDFHVGKLVEKLKELKLYENCLITITSDHGEVFGERGLIEHGGSVYQDLIHVPLIIKYPGVRQKAVVEDVVSAVDIMPTVLDQLGYPVPAEVQGRSLRRGIADKPRLVISESFPNPFLVDAGRNPGLQRAVFLGSLKFITSTTGMQEVYDLRKDANEMENLYLRHEEHFRTIEAELSEWLRTVPSKLRSPRMPGREVLERLKSLGYIR